MKTIDKIIEFLNSSVVTAGSVVVGFVGFCMTIFVSVRTHSINRALQVHSALKKYNSNAKKYHDSFEAHRHSIEDSEIKTRTILRDILKDVTNYKEVTYPILSYSERRFLKKFLSYLKKPYYQIDYDQVADYLAELAGRTDKREEFRNG